MQEFKAGDVVFHKSGPRMTVVEVNEDEVICERFNDGKFEKKGFTKAVLEHAPKPNSSGLTNSPQHDWRN